MPLRSPPKNCSAVPGPLPITGSDHFFGIAHLGGVLLSASALLAKRSGNTWYKTAPDAHLGTVL